MMQRLARPFRIRMLAIDFLEFLGRLLRILLGVEEIEALVVEPVGGLIRAASSFLLNRSKLLQAPQAPASSSDRAQRAQSASHRRRRAALAR